MRRVHQVFVAGIVISVCTIFVLAYSTGWLNGQNASNVLGQATFVTSGAGAGADQMSQPWQAAVDPVSGKIFVVDFGNSRVLRFPAAAATINGATAEAVLGAPGPVSATTMNGPGGIAIDSGGRLWVADVNYHRVLRFDNAATIPSGSPANSVLGQPNLSSGGSGTPATAANLLAPFGVSTDTSGRLYVADSGHNRVLRFDNAASLAPGSNASGVLGQTGFSTMSGGAGFGMGDPRGVYADNSGRLWVADAFNNRVLRFDNAAALTGSPGFLPPPSVVFGQPNFSSGTAGTDRNTFSNPCGVWLDASGRLYVADSFNSRVMIFNNAPSLGNGPPASNVLGQPNFTTSTANTTQDGLRGPRRVSYDESTSSLYVADLSNNRVTRFTPSTFTAAGVSVSGRIVDRYGYGIRGARITFTDERGGDRVAVTNAFGYYTLSDLAAGQAYLARVSSKGLVFPSRLIQVNDSIAGADFSAQ